ncbi:surfeit locus protein 2 [Centropristis striata]|uniref:surfeit locus protein 2 n=1 Tax=Centropristis striata TaxID=184440 RepID=UPI0027E13140|nr:surfeit locus protein 2 [Centropristis striata]XP_059214170.1 surfeit locus protein 2 [Centropristis striata]
MDELPADLRAFLLNHPFLQLTDGKKIKCTLNGHEFPCNLTELKNFTKGKKYEKLSAAADFNYSQYEPHVVPSTKQPNQFFCKLTLRHLNRQPHHVLRHVNGKRFKKALSKYEECVKQGIEYVPARLTQKRPKDFIEEVSRGKPSKHKNNLWEPASSEEDHSDSEDSMSDLYPSTMFTVKDKAEESMEANGDEEEDDFQTDEEDEMEVDKPVVQKRKKAQGGGFQKKFRNNHWKSGRKKQGKVPNGK